MPFTVAGKTAIVTGAGSGINLAFAELLLAHNCNVVFADLSLRPEARDVVSSFSSENTNSPRAVFVETDVTSWPALENMFDVAYAEFGDVHVVCPGAGVYEPHWSNFWLPPGSKQSRDKVDAGHYALLDINLAHPIRTTQLAISKWLYPDENASSPFPTPAKATPENPKRIVHISSVAAQIPVFRAPLYGASKSAITGFVRAIAPLDAEGIRVNAVAPGVVKTPLWSENPEKLANVDQSRDAWVSPLEVAQAMLDCVQKDERTAGMIVEVGAKNTRVVTTYNDAGPDFSPEAGIVTSNSEVGDKEAWGFLHDKTVWSGRADK
ncbi:Short-chain dehydrogenase [Geosmithia morbida]|uniref:Short-chain dehydrogenase n=1 Tax=Geosmithia morbida TaxID=1094350 RepID=A0A9P4YRK6_9HYPO|nr:Short-chain dehydrogenase [Geosmithia morbida]KAF4120418.1 Short-chain dehydrogenase [Geosmithia morbida]